MPICKKCNEQFPNRLSVNGKIVNVQNRKYCLNCSPYGEHNTKKIEIGISETRSCPKCKNIKNRKEFYQRRNINGSSVYCKTCTNLQTVERQQTFKKKCVEYKGGFCSVCGYKKYFGALELHHTNPNEKEFTFSRSKLLAFDKTITDELDKCILLCSNCHREIHAKLKRLI